HNREAQWFSRFERDAMHENAGFAETRYNTVREIAGTLRCAPRENHHVADSECFSHGLFQNCSVIRERPEYERLPTGFTDRGSDDRAVTVVDSRWLERIAGFNQFVAGRKHRDLRTSDHLDASEA